MKTSRIYYEYKINEIEKEELCFTCAVQLASAAKATERAHPGSIAMLSCGDYVTQCDHCGCYLNDVVSI